MRVHNKKIQPKQFKDGDLVEKFFAKSHPINGGYPSWKPVKDSSSKGKKL